VTVYVTSLDDLTSLVNAKASVSLTGEFDVIGIIPTPSGESAKNTKVMLQAKTTSLYQGRKVIYYDRLNLADLAKFQYYSIPIAADVSLHDELVTLRDAFGIKFATTDIENTVTVETENGVEVHLVAKSDSLGWYGEATLLLSDLPHISTAFDSDRLNGF